MQLPFTKMHGLGNDFIVFDAPSEAAIPSAAQLQALADRRTGVGFDQALALTPARRADTAVYYRIFNADGGEVEQCGNGARAVAALLLRQGRGHNGSVRLDSAGGIVSARAVQGELIAVEMGEPLFSPEALPFLATVPAASYALDVDGESIRFAVVSMGNPHAVITVPSAADAPVARLGASIERHLAFPQRVNVGFMQIDSPTRIVLRVFERGVGETLACGTGACAAVAVGRRAGMLAEHVEVIAPGGRLTASWEGPGHSIWLTGPAEISFTGSAEI